MVRAQLPGPDAARPLPGVDERLIWPETRYEVVDGAVCYVSPAEAPHAVLHARIVAVIEAFAAEGFETAVDMLTRTSHHGDMAPDVSVFPEAPDPETGERQLDHLAFEVVSSQTLAHAGRKAAALTERGIRRVFALDVEHKTVLEWSTANARWQVLAANESLVDPAFVVPLPVVALVDAASAELAMAHAMLAKENPVLTGAVAEGEVRGRAEGEVRGRAEGEVRGRAEGEVRGRAEGEARGRAEAIVAVLAARGVPATPAQLDRLRATVDLDRLAVWLTRAATASAADEVFAEP